MIAKSYSGHVYCPYTKGNTFPSQVSFSVYFRKHTVNKANFQKGQLFISFKFWWCGSSFLCVGFFVIGGGVIFFF